MNLLFADQASVDREKITEYLLSPTHPTGRKKAEFFSRFGFRREQWEALAEAFQRHGTRHEVVRTVTSAHGTRYAIDGPLDCPDGRSPIVRTVWMIETGSSQARLITAHPMR